MSTDRIDHCINPWLFHPFVRPDGKERGIEHLAVEPLGGVGRDVPYVRHHDTTHRVKKLLYEALLRLLCVGHEARLVQPDRLVKIDY